jgi:hypothetical protein
MSSKPLPTFIEDQSTEIGLSKNEFIQEKKRERKKRNKIYQSYFEPYVQEMLLQKASPSEVVDRLKEMKITVSHSTVQNYIEDHFQDLNDKAIQQVREKVENHLKLDEETTDKIYARQMKHHSYLSREFERIGKEIEGYRAETEALDDLGEPKLSASEKIYLVRVIHAREEKLDEVREKLADLEEGPNGYLQKVDVVIKDLSESLLKISLPEITKKVTCPNCQHVLPENNLTVFKAKLRDVMARYDDISYLNESL